jgi:hypothetical protein
MAVDLNGRGLAGRLLDQILFQVGVVQSLCRVDEAFAVSVCFEIFPTLRNKFATSRKKPVSLTSP